MERRLGVKLWRTWPTGATAQERPRQGGVER